MYILRHVEVGDKLFQHLGNHLLFSIFPEEVILRCSEQFPSQVPRRIRQFTPQIVFLLLLMSTLWPRESLHSIWKKLARAFSIAYPSKPSPPGTKPEPIAKISRAAISYQRARFPSEILHLIMKTCCLPLCHLQRTPGAFYHKLRLVAIDGTRFNAPDTPANVHVFGRSSNQCGQGPYPQVQGVVLMECGSRAVLDVSLGSHARAEIHALPALLTSLTADMLVLMDSGFFSAWFCEQVQDVVGAEFLSAITSTMALTPIKRLPDGSYLAEVQPRRQTGHRGTRPIIIRVIEYFLEDDRFGPVGQCHRLATSLLDERLYPAMDLIRLYHERWEVETMIDESKTHQREQVRVLRSRTPDGVRQEVYALFLAHYAISLLKCQAAEEQGIDPDRISFTSTLCEIRDAIGDSLRNHPKNQKGIVTFLKQQITQDLLPERLLRINPREVKKVPRKYVFKQRGVPAVRPFQPEEQFLDYVEIWRRPDGVRPVGKRRGRKKRSIVSQVGQEIWTSATHISCE
jgi:hypothetical protein